MVLRLNSQILENGLRPVSFHVVPILDLTMSNGIVGTVSRTGAGREGLVADKNIQVFRPALCGQLRTGSRASGHEGWLLRGASPASPTCCTSGLCRNRSRKNEGRRVISGESYNNGGPRIS